jgi:voltage-gated potassium channel
MRRWFQGLIAAPIVRRIGWHVRRIGGNLDKGFYRSLILGLTVVLGLAALAVTVFEKEVGFAPFGQSFYWALTTVSAPAIRATWLPRWGRLSAGC